MKAAVLHEYNTPLVIEEFELPETGPSDVLVKIVASGVCHSDLHVIKGDWPFFGLPNILGHEGAGIVQEVGPEVGDLKPGDHVVLSWKTHCGFCEMCQRGYPNLCDLDQYDPRTAPRRSDTGEIVEKLVGLGTFGTHTLVPRSNVVPIDKDIPLQQASLVGCGVMAGVGSVINTAKVEAGRSVAVFGCGGVGLNCIQGAILVGAEPIIAVDILDNKLEMATKFGATHTINSSQEDAVARIQEITDGVGAHYAFEAIGLQGETFLQSVLCTRKRGESVFVGHAPVDTPIALDARMLIQEKSIISSMYGSARPQIDFPRLINLYRAGKLKIDELITRVYPLEQVNDALVALASGHAIRSVLSIAE